MASVTWAQRLYQFPLGVFGIAVATAIYPLLAKQSNDIDTFGSTIKRGLRLVIFIGLPASAGLLFVGEPLAVVVFQGNNFTSANAVEVGTILLGYATAVWAYSMTQILTKGFYAKDDAMVPVKVALFCVGLNFVLNILLIWTPLNTSGLAWSTAICGVLQAGTLLLLIRKYVSNPMDSSVLQSWKATTLLTIVMSVVVWLIIENIWHSGGTWLLAFIALVAGVVAGLVVFGFGSIVLRRPELHWALGRTK